MAFTPVANTILVFTEFLSISGARYGNTFWVRDDQAGILAPRVGACLDVFQSWLSTSKMLACSNQMSAVRLNGRDMTVENGQVEDRALSPAIVGGNASPLLPASNTFCLSLRTGLAGRSFRGRHYWTGLAEGSVVGDFIVNAATADIFRNSLLALRTALDAADFDWVVVSRESGGVPRAAGVATSISSILYVDLRIDTQRRRLIGEGS